MVGEGSILVMLIWLVDRLPMPARPTGRGRPRVYSDRLFVKGLVVMILRHLPTVHLLLAVLDQPTAEMQQVRRLLTEGGRYPTRRTWERRLGAIPDTLPAQIGCLGRYLVDLLQPWHDCGRAAAIDSTVLAARGGVWHRKHREAGVVPHSSIDTEARWTRSGWHGWVYGWKLHLVTTVAAVWLPLAAYLTPANAADNETAPELLPDLPDALRFLLGDTSYDDPELAARCEGEAIILVTTRRGAYPQTDGGSRCGASFTGCAPTPLKTSMSTSRPSSMCTSRCPPAAGARPAGSSWARCWSTNSPSGSASRPVPTSGWSSSRSSGRPEEL